MFWFWVHRRLMDRTQPMPYTHGPFLATSLIDSGLVGSTSGVPRERTCSRDTYPESCITEYISIKNRQMSRSRVKLDRRIRKQNFLYEVQTVSEVYEVHEDNKKNLRCSLRTRWSADATDSGAASSIRHTCRAKMCVCVV